MIHFRRWRRNLYRWAVRTQGSPIAIARGMALGLIFGCVMPPGIQLFTGIPITVLLRGSVPAVIVGTFISNPFTYVPLYVFNCKVGELFLNLFGADVSLGADLRAAVEAAGQGRWLELPARIWELLPCWVSGGLIVGLACSVPGYYLTYLIVIELRKLRDFAHVRRATRHQELRKAPPAREIVAADEPDEEAPDEQPPPPLDEHRR